MTPIALRDKGRFIPRYNMYVITSSIYYNHVYTAQYIYILTYRYVNTAIAIWRLIYSTNQLLIREKTEVHHKQPGLWANFGIAQRTGVGTPRCGDLLFRRPALLCQWGPNTQRQITALWLISGWEMGHTDCSFISDYFQNFHEIQSQKFKWRYKDHSSEKRRFEIVPASNDFILA